MKRDFPLLTLILLFLVPSTAAAQNAILKGRIIDSTSQKPLAGVELKLTRLIDTMDVRAGGNQDDGSFEFTNLRFAAYRLEATYVGHVKLVRIIQIDVPVLDAGDLRMSEGVIPLGEVVVTSRMPTVEQVGDTTVYNARVFKTDPDAAAEDLVAKMPGIIVDNNGVKAEGEDVQQILVDGRPFFGSDPLLALRNLPAEVIEKVQVYDKMSDQAEFTGFDDGQSVKTINIITRPDRRNTQFGKIFGGYGEDSRYAGGGNLNLFAGDRRVSLIGLSNNVNQQNFSMQDILGVIGNGRPSGGFGGGGGGFRGGGFGGGSGRGGMRSGPPGGRMMSAVAVPFAGGNPGNFLVGQQSGLSTVNSFGTNYTDSWGQDLSVSGSYFLNLTDNENPQTLSRQYVLSADSNSYYRENSNAENKNYNHRLNFRVQYELDSLNSFILTPSLNLQSNRSSSSLNGINSLSETSLLSQTDNNSGATTDGYTLTSHIVYRHKFEIPGRTLSIDLGVNANRRNRTNDLQSLISYFSVPAGLSDTVQQQAGGLSHGSSISSRLVYTEPLSVSSMVEVHYNPTITKNSAQTSTYSFDPATGQYSLLDTRLSNTADNTYTTQNAGVGYRLRSSGLNLIMDVAYQISSLRNDQSFPFTRTIGKTFYNVLPSAMLSYVFGSRSNLRVFYRTSTNPPSISQLQDVVDNSNPLLLTTGNPNLKQAYSHMLMARYSAVNVREARNYFVMFSVGYTQDYIGNSTLIAQQDSLLSKGVRLTQGTQLTKPVNLDGNWNARSFFTYGFPLDLIKSNLNLNTGLSYTRTPGLINSVQNASNSYAVSQGLVVGSNISEGVDFTLSYTANYNIVKNTLQPDLNNNYFSHTGSFRFNWIFWEGVVFRNDLSNILYNGLTGGYDQNYILWNAAIGKKFFQNDRGEIRLSVNDILRQNKSVSRTVSDTYVEDTQNKVLGRYVMLTFTYTIR
jgi:hypothetical protein